MATAFETYMELEMGARAPFLIGDIDPNTSTDPVVMSAPNGVFYRRELPDNHQTIWFKDESGWVELLRKDDMETSQKISVVLVLSDYGVMPTDTHILVDSSSSMVEIELPEPPEDEFRELRIKPKKYTYPVRLFVTDPLTQTIEKGFSEPDTELFVSGVEEVIHLIGHDGVWEIW